MAQYRTDAQALDAAMRQRYEVQIPAIIPVLHQMPGIKTVHRAGYRGSLQNGVTEIIWGGPSPEPYLPTVASQLTLVSTNAADTNVHVTVYGLDANYNEIQETLTLNGLTNVVTTQSFIRCISTIVSNGVMPLGDVHVTIGANYVAHVSVGVGRGLNGSYTIPAGYTGYLIKGDTAAGKGGDAEVRMLVRQFERSWVVGHIAQVYQNQYMYDFPLPMPIPEKTDIRVSAKSTNTGTSVSCNFDIILVKNP